MTRTVYKNASGLPDAGKWTTARDQALLGLKIQERFPKYYRYFATQAFQYRGNSIRNHNRLLGWVEGVDGIKTGYTRASGFNLVSSVRRSGCYIVAVVLGGASGSARDARMRVLIDGHIKEASLKRTGTAIAAAPEPAESARGCAPGYCECTHAQNRDRTTRAFLLRGSGRDPLGASAQNRSRVARGAPTATL